MGGGGVGADGGGRGGGEVAAGFRLVVGFRDGQGLACAKVEIFMPQVKGLGGGDVAGFTLEVGFGVKGGLACANVKDIHATGKGIGGVGADGGGRGGGR